jgi:hypothetical protein
MDDVIRDDIIRDGARLSIADAVEADLENQLKTAGIQMIFTLSAHESCVSFAR